MGGLPRSAALAVAIALVSSAYTTAACADDPVISKTPAAPTEPQWPTPAISPLPFAPPTDPCKDEWDWVATQCELTWYGVRLYGIYDVGVGYQTAGAPFNGTSPFGTTYLIHRINLRPTWTLAPNALSNSALGVQAYEPFAPDWAFVFDYSFYYDPYSLQFENGIGSMYQNRGLPLALQTSNYDSSRNGQPWNNTAYIGVSSPTYGTLTFFRQLRYNARSRSVRAKFNSRRPGTCSLILLWTSYFVSSISAPTSGNNSVYSGVCASGVRGEGSVPEPSTWALTLAGFAGCGITVCRVRKSAALAA